MTGHLKYAFWLFPVVGVALSIGGLAYRRRLKVKVADCERTLGAIIDNIRQRNIGQGTPVVYLPVVEYFVGNTRFTVTGDTGYWRPKGKGSKLSVMFRPANPSEAFIEKDYYLGANILLLIGGAFILLGSFLAYEFCV